MDEQKINEGDEVRGALKSVLSNAELGINVKNSHMKEYREKKNECS